MNQYSAKLLFQWNPTSEGKEYRKRRVCEERIFTYPSESSADAVLSAKRIGKDEEFTDDSEGKLIKYEFVGVLELIELLDSGGDVWYRLRERVIKKGSLKHLIPKESELGIIKRITKNKLKAW